jgi:low affinity Fe/Cu permease
MNGVFAKFAHAASKTVGSAYAFIAAITLLLGWLASGPAFHYSDTWQLIINTSTTIITFLMVFLIQNTQNRDMLSMQVKLSELVLGMQGAEDRFAAIEDLTDEELKELHEECKSRAEQTLTHIEQRHERTPKNGTTRNGQSGQSHRAAPSRPKPQRKSAASGS